MQRVRGRLAFGCVTALLMLAPPARAQAQPQTNVEEPTAEYRAAMKSMAEVFFKPSNGRLAEEAAEVRRNLADVESFWRTRNAADAVDFAKAAGKAASDLEAAATANDNAQVRSARAELATSCLGCHKTHVGRGSNDSLVIVIQPSQPSAFAPGGGVGRGVARSGAVGVTIPTLVSQVKPAYTPSAMRMGARGEVSLECVVLPDGSVGNVRVFRSLDPVFGLDDEAIKAARQWRFKPGTRDGEPVAVAVVIQMTFTLR